MLKKIVSIENSNTDNYFFDQRKSIVGSKNFIIHKINKLEF